jgi:cyclohexanecarboxylate-CoA ligase
LLACAKVKAVFAPVMMTIGARELERVLRRLDAAVCVSVDRWSGTNHAESVAEMAPRLPRLRHRVVLTEGDAPEGAVHFGRHFQLTAWEKERKALQEADAEDPDRVAVVLFTSGTTGEPKGALHTFNTLYAGASPVVSVEELGCQDRFFTTQALTHMFGVMYNVMIPLLAGGTSVLLDTWKPETALQIVTETGITVLGGAPPYLGALVGASRVSGKPPALRMVLCGSTTIPGQLVAEVREVWGVPLRSFWGMTEVPGHAWTRSDDPPLWALHSDGRPGSGIELDFRSDTGAAPTLEQPARLFVRGGGVCLATIGRDSGLLQVTSHLDGGWYDTGDLAVPDGRGGLRLTGRIADRIGGSFMIPVRDVEAELLTHPDVADVALVGYPDGQGGELACAVVVPGKSVPTLAALREYLSARGMTRWYQPSRLELMPELPRNETGKIRRNLLRTRVREGLRTSGASAV